MTKPIVQPLSPVLRNGGALSGLGRVLRDGLLLFAWLLLCAYLAFKCWERQRAIELLPAAIEPAGVHLIAQQDPLGYGCGAAIFALSDRSRNRLQRDGFRFLQTARQGREQHQPYTAWQATPLPPPMRRETAASARCARLAPRLQQRVEQAGAQPGAFYSRTDTGVLLLIPAQGLIAFLYGSDEPYALAP